MAIGKLIPVNRVILWGRLPISENNDLSEPLKIGVRESEDLEILIPGIEVVVAVSDQAWVE